MSTTLRICTLFIAIHVVYGFVARIETVDEWNITNRLFEDQEMFLSRGKLYHAGGYDRLILYSIEKKNPVNCTIAEKFHSPGFFDARGVKHLENGKVLIFSTQKIFIINTTSCTIEGTVDNVCKIIFPRVDSFDCYVKDSSKTIWRYSDKGEFINSFGIETVHSYGIYTEFEKPSANKSYFMWEETSHRNFWTQLKILNSSYGIVKRDYLMFENTKYFSVAHDRLTGCIPWFNVELSEFNGNYKKFIECVLVDWKNEPATNVTVSISAPVEVEKKQPCKTTFKQLIAVQNLPGGGAIVLYNRESVYKPSNKVYYRIIDAQGRVSGKEEIFYEFKYDWYEDFSMYAFEKNQDICGVFANKFIIVTKCVKLTVKKESIF